MMMFFETNNLISRLRIKFTFCATTSEQNDYIVLCKATVLCTLDVTKFEFRHILQKCI